MPILRHIAQLATCPPDKPQADAGLIADAALVWRDDCILWAGAEKDLPKQYGAEEAIDCCGGLVVPGLVDCHTHLCFGGWRADEFELRLRGATYQEIAAAGGGILSTVAATRAADADELEQKARAALDGMLRLGVTTVECKSGYGLDEKDEVKILEVYRRLDRSHAVDLVPTFLGAHVVPPEYEAARGRYVDLLCDTLIPRVAREGLARFCDVFVEEGAFSPDEARRVLAEAARHGLGLKLHADQFSNGGGAALAAEFHAVSAEHLEHADEAGIAAMARTGTVAVSLPLASLYLGEPWLPARQWLDAGAAVAIATDFNPGSAPSYHLPLAMTLACVGQRMTPQEALTGATTVAARAISAEDRIGSLLPGYRADLALIAAPTLNHWLYHFVPNACTSVLKAGQWVVR